MNRNRAREGGGGGGGEGKNNATTSSNNNGVIITVYAENPIRSSTRRAVPIKTKRGRYTYSRRAQLLAYTRELRNGDQNSTTLKYQTKKRWFALTKSLQVWFDRLFRRKNKRWRYERIFSDSDEEVCVGEKKAAPKMSGKTTFRRKLRSMLKQVSSCGCKPVKVS